jgi:protein-tyrosine phosphatase
VIAARIEELTQVPGLPRIHRGCDFNLSYENIQDGLVSPEKYTVNHLNYLLVEFPDLNISPAIDKVFVQFLDRGIVPIITHPERNGLLQQRIPKLTAWVNEGCLLQVTALSITGGFGKEARDCAWDLLQRGLVHVVASDAHDPEHRHTRLSEAREAVGKRFGEETADSLFEFNPRAVIEGQDPSRIQSLVVEPKRKWFSFLR